MTDLVERLRDERTWNVLVDIPLLQEAAAEIERLRADLHELTEPISDAGHTTADGLRAEIERLREQHELALLVHDKMAAEIERLRAAWDASIAERGELMAEIEQLRAALKQGNLAVVSLAQKQTDIRNDALEETAQIVVDCFAPSQGEDMHPDAIEAMRLIKALRHG